MSFEKFATYREIKSQTEAWAHALEVIDRVSLPKASAYDQVIFTGCGSTYYLSLAAAALYQELTGCAARAVPAGELLLNSKTVVSRNGNPTYKTLLVAISRSGTTTQTIKAVEKFKAEERGEIIVISTYDAALSRLMDVNIVSQRDRKNRSLKHVRSRQCMWL